MKIALHKIFSFVVVEKENRAAKNVSNGIVWNGSYVVSFIIGSFWCIKKAEYCRHNKALDFFFSRKNKSSSSSKRINVFHLFLSSRSFVNVEEGSVVCFI